MNCWEYKKCGREEDGTNVKEHGVCPAFPGHGTACARVLDTHCGPVPQESLVLRIQGCLHCDFYYSRHYEFDPSP